MSPERCCDCAVTRFRLLHGAGSISAHMHDEVRPRSQRWACYFSCRVLCTL
jgi:hypothetical protein